MKIATDFVDKNGEKIFYGDVVSVDRFNGIYNFVGLCRVEMQPVLVPLPNQDDKGFNWSGATAYLNKKQEYSHATKVVSAAETAESQPASAQLPKGEK